MSNVGKALIAAIKEAKEQGLVTLQASSDVAKPRKKLKLAQKKKDLP